MRISSTIALALFCAAPGSVFAQSALSGDPIAITRAAGQITIDGDLSDEGWRDATRVDKWYETKPGDNTEPKVKNVGYLDLRRSVLLRRRSSSTIRIRAAIRAPFADRDNIGNGYQRLRRHHPRHAQHRPHRARSSSSRRATSSTTRSSTTRPARTRRRISSGTRRRSITDHGWTLEMRIPFSSLRYQNGDPQTWGIMLYRNYPRDRPLPVLLGEAAARRQLLHLPLERADRARAAAVRRPPRRRAVRQRRASDAQPRDDLGLAAR